MIIVEGCDGTGKTTLANRLSKDVELSLVMKEPIKSPQDIQQRVYCALAECVQGQNKPLIYDRLFFSELVYGDVLRHRTVFNRVEVDYVFRMLKTLQCPVIFCTAPTGIIQKNVEQSPQLEGVRGNLQQIVDYYRWLITECNRRKLNVMTYDYNELKEGYRYVRKQVQEYLDYRAQRSW